MSNQRDYYQVLGIDRKATADDIRKAYRKLARKFHPDVNKADDAAKRFSEIQEAYDVLSDSEKRSSYDRFGHVGIGAGGPAGGGGFHPGASGSSPWSAAGAQGVNVEFGDFGSLFEDLFGGGDSPFAQAGSSTRNPQSSQYRQAGQTATSRGADLTKTLTISFMTAAMGGTEQIHVEETDSHETLSVRIPAGIEDGGKLRLKGKGQPGFAGGPSGDVIITVEVGQHPWFRREGLDILINVPLTVVEATLGTTVTVPLLKGSIELKIPHGSSGGQKLRVQGRGIVSTKGKKGDFYAVVQVVTPTELSESGRQLLKSLEGELKNPRNNPPWTDL